MQIALQARADAAYGEFAYVASLQDVDLWGQVDPHLVLAAPTRVERDLSGIIPIRPPGRGVQVFQIRMLSGRQ